MAPKKQSLPSIQKKWRKSKRHRDLFEEQKPGDILSSVGETPVFVQASRLNDSNWQIVQRQSLAAGIGQVQGNQAFQYLIQPHAYRGLPVQKKMIQRDDKSATTAASAEDKPKLDYAKAKQGNIKKAASLGWDTRLAEIKPDWANLWNAGNFDQFADVVAAFQTEQGFKKRDRDGILGPLTWDRLRPIGEVITNQNVSWEKSASVCSIATQERLQKGYQRATGQKLVPKEDKDTFRIILHSIESGMDKVDEEYQGTGAAGALVYLGVGEFVSEDDIWNKKALKPGAAMQVWRKKSDLERVKKGKKPESIGTSFVFVKYVKDGMEVLHFNQSEIMTRDQWEVWFGANLRSH